MRRSLAEHQGRVLVGFLPFFNWGAPARKDKEGETPSSLSSSSHSPDVCAGAQLIGQREAEELGKVRQWTQWGERAAAESATVPGAHSCLRGVP